jgi:pimeloyl-[acyl-carrier protein] methyl ester esterase
MQVTLVLLPGMDGTGDLFAPLISRLSRGFTPQVVAYPDNDASYDEHISEVRASLPTDHPYLLVAESYSGPVAVALAAEQPSGLTGVVLCASFLRCPSATLNRINRLLHMAPPVRVPTALVIPFVLGGYATTSLRRLISGSVRKVSPRTVLARLSNVARVDVSVSAKKVVVPCLYLRARSDRLVPSAAGEAVRKAIRSTQVVDLAGPHFLLQSNPAEAVNEIDKFVSRIVAR